MNNDTSPFIPVSKKKKLKLFWPCVLLVSLLAVWFVLQLFGPNPKLRISRETTYITEPLTNGLPDYDEYVRSKLLDGLEPENNQSLAIWLELGPEGDDQPNQRVSDAVGIPVSDLKQGRLIPLSDERYEDSLTEWLKLHDLKSTPNWIPETDLPDDAMSCVWSSEDCPPLAAWMEDNTDVFARLRAACSMTGNASFAWAYGSQHSLGEVSASRMQRREVARLLAARAKWCTGDRRHLDAWNNLKAMHCLGRTDAGNVELVDYLVNDAINEMAWTHTHELLASPNLSVADAEHIRTELKQLPPRPSLSKCLEGERLFLLSYSINSYDMASQTSRLTFYREEYDQDLSTLALGTRLDWNVILARHNARLDEAVRIANITDRKTRDESVAEYQDRFASRPLDKSTTRLIGALLSCRARSRIVADWMDPLDSTISFVFSENRQSIYPAFAEALALLAISRAEVGEYPDSLNDVVVHGEHVTIPADFSGLPLQYEKTETGFVLRSLGVDEIVDGRADPFVGDDTVLDTSEQAKTIVDVIRTLNILVEEW